MSAEAEYTMTCDGCEKDITGENCYCNDCMEGGKGSETNLKNRALKSLFTSGKAYNDIEQMLGLTQLETMTLRDMVS